MEKKKRDWVKLLTLGLCVVLLIVNFRQGKRLENLERRISDMQIAIMDDIRSMESTVYTQLREEDKLVQNWDYTPSVNMGKGTFVGVLEIPLDRGRLEFSLDIVTRDGTGQRRENLGGVYDTGELLPVQCTYQGGRTQAEYLKGVFTAYECNAELYTKTSPGGIETEGQVFRLRRNGEIAAEQAAEPGDGSNSYFCGRLASEAQPGDRMTLTFFCRDENGLGYEFLFQSWIAVEERDVAPGGSEWEDWLRLTWE